MNIESVAYDYVNKEITIIYDDGSTRVFTIADKDTYVSITGRDLDPQAIGWI